MAELRRRIRELEAVVATRADPRLDALLRTIPDFVYFKDRERRFVAVSQAFERMFERPTEDILGRRDEDLFPPEVARETVPDDERVLAGEPVLDRIEGGDVTDTQRRWVSTTKVPWRNERGEIIGIVGISRDVTHAKIRFEDLQREYVEAQRMETIGRLSSGIAHDFNNILTVIFVAASRIQNAVASDSAIQKDIESLFEAAERARQMTTQLLSVARGESRAETTADLGESLEQMDVMIRRLLPEDVRAELRVADQPMPVTLGAAAFNQIVLNLVVNARDAMPQGGVICLEARPAGTDRVELAIADTGCGIDETLLPKIFDPLFSTKARGVGTGLGLATVRALVDAAGGEILVESRPGSGTTFRVRLPLHHQAPTDGPPLPDAFAGPLEGTVLVVDDDRDIRRVLGEMMRGWGLRVLTASDPEEAATLVTGTRVDVVLTDVLLRRSTGLDVATRVQAVRPGVRVLFMSGFTDDLFQRQGIEVGDLDILPKPFTEDDLRAHIAPLLVAP